MNPETSKVSSGAAASLRRQNEALHLVVTELSKAEDQREVRMKACKRPGDRKGLERRFGAERRVDAERVERLREETGRIRQLAELGEWEGTARDGRPKVQSVGDRQVSGLEARGGLTDTQYKFLKEVYTKFEAPVKPPPSNKPRAPNISYFRNQKAAAFNARIESDRRGLLGEKKMLLGRLANVVEQQGALVRHDQWSSRTAASTGRSSYATGRSNYTPSESGRSVRSTASTAASMASFRTVRGVPKGGMRATVRPSKVPQLF